MSVKLGYALSYERALDLHPLSPSVMEPRAESNLAEWRNVQHFTTNVIWPRQSFNTVAGNAYPSIPAKMKCTSSLSLVYNQ